MIPHDRALRPEIVHTRRHTADDMNLAGISHGSRRELVREQQLEEIEICEQAGLPQILLLAGSAWRVRKRFEIELAVFVSE